MQKVKITNDVKEQFEKITDYYNWLTFEPDQRAACPAWDIFDDGVRLGTIFYYGSWRMESPEDQWGDDFDLLVEDIPDFYNE